MRARQPGQLTLNVVDFVGTDRIAAKGD